MSGSAATAYNLSQSSERSGLSSTSLPCNTGCKSKARTLWYKHNRHLPEGGFLTGRVEHRYLAIVLAGREFVQWNRELKRRGFQAIGPALRDFNWLRLERFFRTTIEAHESDEGAEGFGGLLVCLQIDVHVSFFTEHSCDTRD